MPGVTLVNGKPDGARGQAFKISRFKDMEIKAMGQADPSSFKSATVYVFDSSGAKILEKDFPIDLPAPKPDPKPIIPPAVQPAKASETTAAPAATAEDADASHDAGRSTGTCQGFGRSGWKSATSTNPGKRCRGPRRRRCRPVRRRMIHH
jgi:hypothetical protein